MEAKDAAKHHVMYIAPSSTYYPNPHRDVQFQTLRSFVSKLILILLSVKWRHQPYLTGLLQRLD